MASKTSPRPGGGGNKPVAKGGRRPSGKPVPIKQPKPWGMIALGTVVAVVAISIIGYGVFVARDAGKPFGSRGAQQIEGMKNFRETNAKDLGRNHKTGTLSYKQSPPVGGDHNPTWQNCEGTVYDKEIAKEHAVHSLEHGAVWITYRPDLPKAQIDALKKKVQGKQYALMSPYPGLDKPISLQAWGLQLKVDKASDARIDKFIANFRQSATVEDGAVCSGGVTATGAKPQETAPAGAQPTS
jgi:hypothetical protein